MPVVLDPDGCCRKPFAKIQFCTLHVKWEKDVEKRHIKLSSDGSGVQFRLWHQFFSTYLRDVLILIQLIICSLAWQWMQSVAVGESASSAMLKRDNGSKRQHWNSSRISHHCKNIPSSSFAHVICPYVCVKPDEYTNETTVEFKQSHSSCLQPRSPKSTLRVSWKVWKPAKYFHLNSQWVVLSIIHYQSCWKCILHSRVKICFVDSGCACDTSTTSEKGCWQKHRGLFTPLRAALQ